MKHIGEKEKEYYIPAMFFPRASGRAGNGSARNWPLCVVGT